MSNNNHSRCVKVCLAGSCTGHIRSTGSLANLTSPRPTTEKKKKKKKKNPVPKQVKKEKETRQPRLKLQLGTGLLAYITK